MPARPMHTFTYSVVTPLFLGDALRDATRFSLTSFKGQLRFWWRALAWEDCWKQAGGDEGAALRELHRREALLFGKAAEERITAGQSHVVLRLRSFQYDRLMQAAPPPHLGKKRLSANHILNRVGTGSTSSSLNGLQGPPIHDVVGEGSRYLGYGLLQAFRTYQKDPETKQFVTENGRRLVSRYEGELDRSCFLGARFEVDVTVRPVLRLTKPGGGFQESEAAFRRRKETIEEEKPRVLKAAKLLGLLGGLGARVRRGWGSLTLEKLEGPDADWRKPESIAAYRKAVRDIVGRPQVGRPPFSAFSAESRVDLLATGTEFLALLDRVGREMARYRAWGFNGKLPDGEPALQRFRGDRDWAKQPWTGERNGYLPKRAAFGLPHNYGPNCHNAGVTTTGADGAGDRRGSPLFLHIQDLGRGGFAAVATFLPAAFTPDGKAKAKWDRGGYVAPVPTNWRDTITGWLEGDYPRNGRTVKFFPDREPLLP